MKRKKSSSTNSKRKTINKKNIQPLNIHKTRWISRAKRYNPYPSLVIISIHRRNIFFNVTDYMGHTHFWASAGRYGFQGRDRKQFMAIREMTDKTFDIVHKRGIKRVILVLKNHHRSNIFAIKYGLKNNLKRKENPIKIISWTRVFDISFNGCQLKKTPRKKKHIRQRKR